jgi:antitoxin (DNA-binding transcriptional repressor) of toxin-antitoxin stability system
MTITVNIGDADLNELLSKVEAGEEVILVRGIHPRRE